MNPIRKINYDSIRITSYGNIDKEALALLANVISDIKQRDHTRQTLDFYQTDQVNVHSKVDNKYNEQ